MNDITNLLLNVSILYSFVSGNVSDEAKKEFIDFLDDQIYILYIWISTDETSYKSFIYILIKPYSIKKKNKIRTVMG